jgi:formate dehydrogenase major subunit
VSVPEGTSVMRAAALAGVKVPKLCATDTLKAFGSCRLCLVEVEGRKGYPASCTTTVAAGMKIRTQSEKLMQLRRGVIDLYVSDHPLDCDTCPAQGHCELEDMAKVVGIKSSSYARGAMHRPAQKDESNPYFAFDPTLCIVCSRCVRACDEQQGTFALTIQSRGFDSKVSASQDQPFLESECVSCGACVEACPTGALIEKSIIGLGKSERAVGTTCAYCGVGCGLRAEVRGEGEDTEVVRMAPDRHGRANHGHACVKGRFAYGYATHADRVLKPMIRKSITDDNWREVSWEEAISLCRKRDQAHPGEVRPRLGGRHHLFALHQRGDVPGAEARARSLRQQ